MGTLNHLALALVLALTTAPAHAQDDGATCPHPEGWRLSPEELQATLQAHKNWYDNEGWRNPAVPGRAVLCNANLSEIQLEDAFLVEAQLEGADLSRAQLDRANLEDADLSGANLHMAGLQGANLSGAQLEGALLARARLLRADLWAAQLEGANLFQALLVGADLTQAQLKGAVLVMAHLASANLEDADLSGADLRRATLVSARLLATNLEGAKLSGAVLFGAMYEAAAAPARGHLTDLRGLTTVRFGPGHTSGFAQLRTLLGEAGLRDLEREATYALERQITRHKLQAWREQPLASLGVGLEGVIRRVAFEWPVGYGLYPGRALRILLWSIGGFALIYIAPLTIAASGRSEEHLVLLRHLQVG